MWRLLSRAWSPGSALPPELWRTVERRVPQVAALAPPERLRLRELAGRFLARKAISGAGGFEPDPEQRAIVAALCCRPVLELGFSWLRGWREVILYPAAFRVHRRHHDEDSGVVTEWPDELAGEAWEQGPLILSWEDLEADLADPFAGYDLVAHEIAHKLDLLDGVADGTPPLPRGIALAEWVAAMQPAYEGLVRAVERGAEPAIDGYAAEGPDEFFAVVSEYFFSAPARLAEAMPGVHALLARFYRPSRSLSSEAAARR